MREYAKVAPTFWTGDTGKELRRRGHETVIVALYLMTSPSSNMMGIFYQPILYMAHETGLGEEGARKGLRNCCEASFCDYDEDSQFVWVREMAGWQIAKQLKASDNRCVGIQREYDALPKNPFLGQFFDHYRLAFHLQSRRGIEGASETLPSKEQEQEQEQKKNLSPSSDGFSLESDSKAERTAKRIGLIASQAISAFNASKLVRTNGGHLSVVNPNVGQDKRKKQVQRCLRVASEICQDSSGSPHVGPAFWDDYFDAVGKDPFRSGREKPGSGHANWRPDFEYLTREDTMLKIFDKAQEDAKA